MEHPVHEALASLVGSKIERCYLDLDQRSLALIVSEWSHRGRRARTIRFRGISHCLSLRPIGYIRDDGVCEEPPSSHDAGVYQEIAGVEYTPGGRSNRIELASRHGMTSPLTWSPNVAVEMGTGQRDMLFKAAEVEIDDVIYPLQTNAE